ncbi:MULTISPECIES: hypothetical protein [unclassified Microcoleus]
MLTGTGKHHYKDARGNEYQLKRKGKLPDREYGMQGLIGINLLLLIE